MRRSRTDQRARSGVQRKHTHHPSTERGLISERAAPRACVKPRAERLTVTCHFLPSYCLFPSNSNWARLRCTKLPTNLQYFSINGVFAHRDGYPLGRCHLGEPRRKRVASQTAHLGEDAVRTRQRPRRRRLGQLLHGETHGGTRRQAVEQRPKSTDAGRERAAH